MAQANGIVLRIRTDKTEEFERLFEAEELPLWDEFCEQRKFLIARLARVEYGTEEAERDDVAVYLLYVEVPGMTEHTEHARIHDSRPIWNGFSLSMRSRRSSSAATSSSSAAQPDSVGAASR